MSELTHTPSEQYSQELASLLDMDTSLRDAELDLEEITLSEETKLDLDDVALSEEAGLDLEDITLSEKDIALEALSSETESLEHAIEAAVALPLNTESISFVSSQGKRPFAIANTMAQATSLENLYQITVTELRKLFAVDRALIYQFQSPTYGTVIAESVTPAYRPALGQVIAALAFGAIDISSYEQQSIINVSDTAEAAVTPYQMQLYQHLQVQANLSLPIFLRGELWGLLVIQTCSDTRQWTRPEIARFYQIGTELTLKLQSHELNKQSQQEVTRENLLKGILNNVRDAADIQPTFESTARTLHNYLQTDRVIIFQFDSTDNRSTGQIVAEKVSANFSSAKELVMKEHYVSEKMTEAFSREQFWSTADVYEQGLSKHHLDTLARIRRQLTKTALG
ncbi:MAG: GAF domain-containing protein [Cyanobacteria bacterium P01_D01_bin.56]